jgi:hypothetical protein
MFEDSILGAPSLVVDSNDHLVVFFQAVGKNFVLYTTTNWRPLDDLVAIPHFLLVPSGFVPGIDKEGHSSSSQCSDGSRGHDCIFQESFQERQADGRVQTK